MVAAALHHHHAHQDDVVWPKRRSRAPAHEADVERMEEEHTEIAAAVDHVRSRLPTWTKSAEAALTQQLSAASGQLSACLDRHRDDERRKILSGAPIPQRLVVQLFARRSLAAYRRRLYAVSG